jgi:ubiquinone/menaquinone biosynthesis C-methylase UbiE
MVRNYLEKYVKTDRPLTILELGCGTGEDAIYLARLGHKVLATDISEEMVLMARKKAGREKLAGRVTFKVMDMSQLNPSLAEETYDLVFTNFGAMNCLAPEEVSTLLRSLGELLAPGARLIGVIMPRYCFWESFYFLMKGKWKTAFRRSKRDGVPALIGGSEVRTWYYSSRNIRKFSHPYFEKVRTRPVGLFLPPSYLDPFFSNKRGLLRMLAFLERKVRGFSFLSGSADHFIFELKRKE